MGQDLSPDSIRLISELIDGKNKELKEHFNSSIRMVKTTTREIYAVTKETKELAQKTNGRVTKLENEVYGETDVRGNIIKGKEGILSIIDKNKKRTIQVGAAISAFLMSLQVPQVKILFVKIIDKIF